MNSFQKAALEAAIAANVFFGIWATFWFSAFIANGKYPKTFVPPVSSNTFE
jgi:hypothetical protein